MSKKRKTSRVLSILITIGMLFTLLPAPVFAAGTTVNTVNVLGVTAPVAGAAPDVEVSCPTGTKYHLRNDKQFNSNNTGDIKWNDVTADNKIIKQDDLNSGYTFIEGHVYTATITYELNDKTNDAFDNYKNITALLNSQAASAENFTVSKINVNPTQGLCFVTYRFPILGKAELRLSGVPEIPAGPVNGEYRLMLADFNTSPYISGGSGVPASFEIVDGPSWLSVGTLGYYPWGLKGTRPANPEPATTLTLKVTDSEGNTATQTIPVGATVADTGIDVVNALGFTMPQKGEVPDIEISAPADAKYSLYEYQTADVNYTRHIHWKDVTANNKIITGSDITGGYTFLEDHVYTATVDYILKDKEQDKWAATKNITACLNNQSEDEAAFKVTKILVNEELGMLSVTYTFPKLSPLINDVSIGKPETGFTFNEKGQLTVQHDERNGINYTYTWQEIVDGVTTVIGTGKTVSYTPQSYGPYIRLIVDAVDPYTGDSAQKTITEQMTVKTKKATILQHPQDQYWRTVGQDVTFTAKAKDAKSVTWVEEQPNGTRTLLSDNGSTVRISSFNTTDGTTTLTVKASNNGAKNQYYATFNYGSGGIMTNGAGYCMVPILTPEFISYRVGTNRTATIILNNQAYCPHGDAVYEGSWYKVDPNDSTKSIKLTNAIKYPTNNSSALRIANTTAADSGVYYYMGTGSDGKHTSNFTTTSRVTLTVDPSISANDITTFDLTDFDWPEYGKPMDTTVSVVGGSSAGYTVTKVEQINLVNPVSNLVCGPYGTVKITLKANTGKKFVQTPGQSTGRIIGNVSGKTFSAVDVPNEGTGEITVSYDFATPAYGNDTSIKTPYDTVAFPDGNNTLTFVNGHEITPQYLAANMTCPHEAVTGYRHTPSYSVVSGALPNGLSLDSATGKLSGTPTKTGEFTFTVRAYNTTCEAFKDYTVSVVSSQVPSVALEVDIPETGATPNSVAQVPEGAVYQAGPITWTPDDTEFAESTRYTMTCTVTLPEDSGYHFEPIGVLVATVNGNHSSSLKRVSSQEIIVTYSFPETIPTVTKYEVTFNANGATGTVPWMDAVAEDAPFTLPDANTLTKEGFTFAGWSDGLMTYHAEDLFRMPASDVTFTAQWEPNPPEEPEVPDFAEIRYMTHIQLNGWEKTWKKDGQMSGTSGESKRLEAIKIDLGDTNVEGSIEYRTHIQNLGWETTWKKDGQMSGTSGKAYRLEAIQIRLTGDMKEKYDVYYRVHAQNFGWLDWAKNGAYAGTAGFAYRLEGIEIKLVKKGDPAPVSTKTPYRYPMLSYTTHVQDFGWQPNVLDGVTSGTVGKSKRLEAIKIQLKNQAYAGNIEYKTHIQNIGWESTWKKNGAMSGTSGKAYRLEAIQIRLTGEMAAKYDIYYRVHAQNFGWMGWAKNGASAGTAGFAYRLEGIQIVIVPKGDPAPGSTANCFRQK